MNSPLSRTQTAALFLPVFWLLAVTAPKVHAECGDYVKMARPSSGLAAAVELHRQLEPAATTLPMPARPTRCSGLTCRDRGPAAPSPRVEPFQVLPDWALQTTGVQLSDPSPRQFLPLAHFVASFSDSWPILRPPRV